MTTPTAEVILARVADGPVRIGVLADDIARTCHIHPDEVVATVWDLIGDTRLDYDADAMVRAVR
jgi:hypothetical protein